MEPGEKKINFDKMWLGVALGLIAPALTMFGFYVVNFSQISIRKFIDHLVLMHIQSSLVSLCVVSNLLVFFIFIWTDKLSSARGVLLATFLYGGLVVYLKYFA
jgi:hypothetical protein